MLVRVYIKHVKLDIIYSICTQYGLPITALRNVKNCRATNRVIFNFISNSNFSSQPFINTRISRMLFASLSLKVYQNLILEFNLWFQYIHFSIMKWCKAATPSDPLNDVTLITWYIEYGDMSRLPLVERSSQLFEEGRRKQCELYSWDASGSTGKIVGEICCHLSCNVNVHDDLVWKGNIHISLNLLM